MIKSLFTSIAFIFLCNVIDAQSSLTQFIEETDSFMKKNISNGKVNYDAIKANSEEINSLVQKIEKHHKHQYYRLPEDFLVF